MALYQRKDKYKLHQKKCNPGVDDEGNKENNIYFANGDNVADGYSFTDPELISVITNDGDNVDVSYSLADPEISVTNNGDNVDVSYSFTAVNKYTDPEQSVVTNDGVTDPEISVTSDDTVDIHQQIKEISHRMKHVNVQKNSTDEDDINYNHYGALYDNSCAGVSLYSKLQFDTDLSDCTIQYLKILKHQSKRSNVKLKEFAKLCLLMFKKKFNDTDFMLNLAIELGFSSTAEMIDFINIDSIEKRYKRGPRGRPMSGEAERQIMYDFWISVSDLSNDRRNARHMVKIKPNKCDPAVVGLSDVNITECKTKGGLKFKAQKYIYSHSTRELFRMFQQKHPDVNTSPSLFYRCKPFYITPASTREMECCLCPKCLNPHVLYNTLQRHIKDIPTSLTEYLTMLFECEKDQDTGYPKKICIDGNCKNSCNITDDRAKDYKWSKLVSYYQFEPVTETYFNKKGEKTCYKRIARKDYKDMVLIEVYDLLLKSAKDYLMHRYNVLIDKVFWQQHLDQTNIPVVWMDYSQNIKLVEKKQVQSAHFSGRQHTLHDSLIQNGNEYIYVYHISDDTNHDNIMTNEIIMSNITNHPMILASGRLQLRSDNCATQYKSRFVFMNLLNIAKTYNIYIDCFFGEPGHGRGLIDAMTWFGCKGPMRKEIITNDAWFRNAQEMTSFLKNHFEDDPKKEYHLVEEELTAKLRQKGRKENLGAKKHTLFHFYPDGDTIKLWGTMKDFLEKHEGGDVEVDDEVDFDMELEEPVWSESTNEKELFNLIEMNSFVVIRSPPKSLELFHLMKVEKKGFAEENMIDPSGEHCVLKGEPYLIGTWYSFQIETRKYAQYKEAKGTEKALIHIGEVFSTNVELDEKQRMDIAEYRVLGCNVFWYCTCSQYFYDL